MTTLRIFISSPGDVGEERTITAKVIDHLNEEMGGHVHLEPIFWEHEPLRATASFQEELPRPSQSDICILILWSRLGTRLPAHITRADGTRYASGTEFEFEDALEGHKAHGTPDLMVYRKTAKPVTELDSEELVLDRLAQKRALEQFIVKWFRSEDGSFTAAFHTFDAPAAFEQLLEEHLRKLIEKRLGQTENRLATARWKQGSPFRGLQVFEFEHWPIFFGRTEAIGELLNALRRQSNDGRAFVLILGMSGCGKSSLARAGLLPNLTQPGVIEGIGLWRRASVRPSDEGDDLFGALAAALLRAEALPEIASGGTDAGELATLLRETPKAVAPLVKAALAMAAAGVQQAEKLAAPPVPRMALLVDQLEELFTLERITVEERRKFIAALATLARSGSVWVIATLRSDFYSQIADLPDLVALKEGAGQFDLLPPTPAEIASMIRQPARMAGLRFEEHPVTHATLDDELCDAAARDPEALPLLEFALDQLHKGCDDNGILTYAAYERMGGVEQALATHAEEIFQSLEPEARGAFDAVLGAVVTPGFGDESRIARRRAPVATLCADPAAKALVDAFVEHRLFITDRARDGSAVVGVAHEALLRRWPRVADWARDNATLLRTRARIAAGTALWMEQNRAAGFLLPAGSALDDARQLLAEGRAALSEGEIDYVRASASRADRSRRRRRVMFGAVAAVVVVAILAGLWYRDAYVTPRIAYFADFVKRDGSPEGLHPLTPDEAARRELSLRFTRAGRRGPVVLMAAVNGHGALSIAHTIGAYIGGGQSSLLTAGRECQWEFIHDAQGRVTNERALNRDGRLVYEFAYSSPTTGYYKDANGYPRSRAGSGAAYVTFVRETQGSNAGIDIQIRYTDSRGRPQPNQDGIFGVALTYNPKGEAVSLTNLGADGKPVANAQGVVTAAVAYDDRGRVTEVTTLDGAGKPLRVKDGYATVKSAYDAAGNRVESAYFDETGRPATYNGFHLARATYGEHGDQISEAYFDESGKPCLCNDLYHAARMGYDERGNSVSVDYFDTDAKPTRGAALIAGIRRVFDERSRLIEETYVDEAGQPLANRDGQATRIWKYDARGNLVEESTLDERRRPVAGTDGVARHVYVHDDRDNNIEVLNFDEQDRPVRDTHGVARRVSVFDDRGNILENSHFAPDGSPALYDGEYARIVWTYDEHGNKVAEAYFDQNLRSAPIAKGYARQVMRYDERGQCVERIYRDRDDNPAWDKDGAARYTMVYDPRGNLTELANYDQASRPIRTKNGYAVLGWTYDDRGNELSEYYLDENRRPVANGHGYARIEWALDAAGRRVSESFFGADGKPVARTDGVARTMWTYNARGEEIEARYFAVDGKPAVSGEGHCGYRSKRDARGKVVEMTYLGRTGQPAAIPAGYAIVRYGYNARGLNTTTAFFNSAGEPVMTEYGCASYESKYDRRGRVTETFYLGLDGKPVVTPRGFATLRYRYDDRGNEVERAFFGPDDKPIADSDGFASIERSYDERGRLLTEAYFDAADRPVRNEGYFAVKKTYDDRGNQTAETYLGEDGKPMSTPGGFAGWVAEYDARGNMTSLSGVGADGAPKARNDGVARIEMRYDPRGNKVEQSNLDIEGRLFAPEDGYARATWRFDERDRKTETAFYDADGKLLFEESEEFARATTKYNARGDLVEQGYFGADDRPVAGPSGYARLLVDHDADGTVLRRTYFGADGKTLPTRLIIKRILPDTPAAAAGLRTGDILVERDGVATTDAADFVRRASAPTTRPDSTLTVLRGGVRTVVTVPSGLLGIELEDQVVTPDTDARRK